MNKHKKANGERDRFFLHERDRNVPNWELPSGKKKVGAKVGRSKLELKNFFADEELPSCGALTMNFEWVHSIEQL